MEVHDFLAGVATAVGDHAVAAIDAFLFGDLAHGDEQMATRASSCSATSSTDSIGFFGITTRWTGACGLMSLKAIHRSSS